MILHATGNLLDAEAEALVNTVNTVGVMGKGIALQFKRAYPANFRAYERACELGEVRPGHMFVTYTDRLHPRMIINFPTKRHWKGKARIEDIQNGLRDLVSIVRKEKLQSVAMPPLGCGLGGLDWAAVRPLIVEAFGDLPEVRVLLFAPEGAPLAQEMPVKTERPGWTRWRAGIVSVLEHYRQLGYRASRLELQKIAYFLNAAGEPLNGVAFVKHIYGPYDRAINIGLSRMEGHFITGFGDGTGSSSVGTVPGAYVEARGFLSEQGEISRVERVERLIEGFETPHGMELLATVHWVCVNELDSNEKKDLEAIVARVHGWNSRKKRIFKERDIRLAWEHLGAHGWLEGHE